MASTLSQIVPLFLTIAILSGIAWVLYQVYLSLTQIRRRASESMGRNNVVFSRDGVRVGVRGTSHERYVDATQSFVVKAWNLGYSREDSDLKKK